MFEFFLLALALLFALGATGLFFYAFIKFLRSALFQKAVKAVADALGLSREHQNPLLSSRSYTWEADSVMNPAAVEAGGRVHLFYRAVGSDGVSRIGYASSKDGTTFDDRLPYPVFALDNYIADRDYIAANYPELLASGGSWAGVEDPRAVVLDGRLYLTFTAFGGWDSLRIGTTSISLDDLNNKRWNWTRPVFLSPQGQVHKNWVLFPEKIGGKFAVLHGFDAKDRNRANVAYLDTLDHEPINHIESDSGFRHVEHEGVWDSKVRGAGPPPIKTGAGWLLFYHANDAKEPHRYKLGALLLDLFDPSRVIARSNEPVLAPDAHYENDGKPGIIYACGAIAKGNQLRVYYGGADKVVCSAVVALSDFVDTLLKGGTSVPRVATV